MSKPTWTPPKYIYVVEMNRWGSAENHSYFIGAFTSLIKALECGITHGLHRDNKYEPYITMTEIDAGGGAHNHIVTNRWEANYLYEDITGKSFKQLDEDTGGPE